jgi:hypothetical protein
MPTSLTRDKDTLAKPQSSQRGEGADLRCPSHRDGGEPSEEVSASLNHDQKYFAAAQRR